MSRLHWARISVTEHDEARAAEITDAIAGWQDGAEVRAHSGADGELLFDMTFSLSGGWQMSAAAKSQAYRIGQANGAPCRVGWSGWWVEDGGTTRIEWRVDASEPTRLGTDDAEMAARTLLVEVWVEPADASKSKLIDQLTSAWLSGGSTSNRGPIELGNNEQFVDRVGSWREALTAGVGAHDLTVGAWDMDDPHEVRLFTPDVFPQRDDQALLEPRDTMLSWLPRNGRCMFCWDGTPLKLVGYRTVAPDPEAVEIGIQRVDGRETIAVCARCQATVARRLEHVSETHTGLYETDGNPHGGLGISPTLPCMTCERTIADSLVVINDSMNLTACRQCLADARPLDWQAFPKVSLQAQG